ncbi:efflux transporter, RND family, MFP subunit [Methylobacterium sp. 4-46]|uniref:efflux RND transporter periplasmic adaptor subunit n=1 Tax=unclassified Methylobacterium TaxID=2615210 RepID=UPI000152D16E|nr:MULTISPECIES: HlyD family secretion protein [Methylobacterium]ACA19195.1 efflux transporter, RND family, MFP subunit [Methylobacterium sp. 4-46]WFT78403.1 HlyD family secretion protein [Methylobacterium nodulans]
MTRFLAFLGRFAVTGLLVLVALVVGAALWDYYLEAPWTRDGRVRAEVVGVAPDVSGLVRDVDVKDNQEVKRGDLLFRIDPERFTLALRQAEAVVAGRKATLTQAEADLARYQQLSDNVVSQQRLEQALATEQGARAAYDQAVADRDLAKLNLARSEVRASVNGRISNLELRPGSYVATGKAVLALVDRDTLHVEGYFEETKLDRIRVGDPVSIHLMGGGRDLAGRVESVAAGIEDRERSAGANLLANVNPTFAWVRLAQRVPVRVTLDPSPALAQLTVGRTATVVVRGRGEGEPRPLDGLWQRWQALRSTLATSRKG